MSNDTIETMHFPATIVKLAPDGTDVMSDYLAPGEEMVDPITTTSAQYPFPPGLTVKPRPDLG